MVYVWKSGKYSYGKANSGRYPTGARIGRATSKKVIDNIMAEKRKKDEAPNKKTSYGPHKLIIEYMKSHNFMTLDTEIFAYMKEERPSLDDENIQNLIFKIRNEIAIISNCIKEKGYKASTEELMDFIKKKKIIQGWSENDLKELIESIKGCYTIISDLMKDTTSNEEVLKKAKKAMPKIGNDKIQEIIDQIEKESNSFKEKIKVNNKEILDIIDRLKEDYCIELSDKSKSLESINASFLANNREMNSLAEKFGTSVFRILEEWKQEYVKRYIRENELIIAEMNIEIYSLFEEGISDLKRIILVLKALFSDRIPSSISEDLFNEVIKENNECFFKKNQPDTEEIEV